MNPYPFTYKQYKNVLLQAQKSNYKFINYDDKKLTSNEKIIILRHDIDFSLEQALRMAQLENSCDVKATYFIMLTSDFYNPCSLNSRSILYDILNLGHDIGLHFDEKAYATKNINELNPFILREIKLLSSIIDKKVKSFSFHRPSRDILDSNLQLDKIINTYEDRFFSKIKYLSDSRKEWRDQSIDEVIKGELYPRIQLLIHPIWWEDSNLTFNEIFINYTKRHIEKVYGNLSNNIKDFPDELKEFFIKNSK
ncbi:hypothetical protein [Priestia megaterium]|uniref:hypothetical protein n=1 Tax=Priestia megaterium TaxID=1404 RepID=UPI000697217D|nr:hypothetical protein [Priestia megaterium]